MKESSLEQITGCKMKKSQLQLGYLFATFHKNLKEIHPSLRQGSWSKSSFLTHNSFKPKWAARITEWSPGPHPMTSMSGEKLKNFEYERIIFGENNML
jgi:hypothetical protein